LWRQNIHRNFIKKNTIQELRYETEACIFCQASASTLANIAKNTNLGDLRKNLKKMHLAVTEELLLPNPDEVKLLMHKMDKLLKLIE